MKQVWHIAVKDWRRLLPVVISWICVESMLAVAFLTIGSQALLSGSLGKALSLFEPAEIFVRIVFSIVVVVALVRADLVAGDNLFWVTRPISPLQLLGSKLLSLVVLALLLPMAFHVVWWLSLGVSVRAMPEALLPVLSLHGVLIAVVFPLCMTLNLRDKGGRPLLGFLLLGMAAGFVWASVGNNATWKHLPVDLALTRQYLFFALLMATGWAMVAHQFWRRETNVTTLIFGGGLLVAYIGFHTWPVALLPEPPKAYTIPVEAAELGLTLECRGVRWPSETKVVAAETRAERQQAMDRTRLMATVVLKGKGDVTTSYLSGASSVLEIEGESLQLRGLGKRVGSERDRSDMLSAAIRAIGAKAEVPVSDSIWNIPYFPEQRDDQQARWERRIEERRWGGARLRMYVSGVLSEARKSYAIPLIAGATMNDGSVAARVLELRRDRKGRQEARFMEVDIGAGKRNYGHYLIGPPVETITSVTLGRVLQASFSESPYVRRGFLLGAQVYRGSIWVPDEDTERSEDKAAQASSLVLYKVFYALNRQWKATLTKLP